MWRVSKSKLASHDAGIPEGFARCSLLVLLVFVAAVDRVAAFEVELRAPSFVIRGGSALLRCDHEVDTALLHKVEWLKDGDTKLFQFVRGRNPPFRNFTTPGATLDWSRSNEKEIYLTALDLEASGVYSCEVSMETPIYTKASNDEVITVIQRQSDDPELWGVRTSYVVGERLEVNCTSAPSHPPAHITWLANGRQVSDQSITWFPESSARQYQRSHGGHHHRPFRAHSGDEAEELLADEGEVSGSKGAQRTEVKAGEGEKGLPGEDADRDADSPDVEAVVTTAPSSSTVQLAFQLNDKIVRTLAEDTEIVTDTEKSQAKIRLIITCIATIPDFIGPDHEYADRRLTSFAVDVVSPLSEDGSNLFGSASGLKPLNVILLPLLTLLVLLIPLPLKSLPRPRTSTATHGSAPVVSPTVFQRLDPVRPRR